MHKSDGREGGEKKLKQNKKSLNLESWYRPLRKYLLPALSNYRAGSNSNFKDDYLFRNIEPSKRNRIELARLIKDFTYECYTFTKQQLFIYRFVWRSN